MWWRRRRIVRADRPRAWRYADACPDSITHAYGSAGIAVEFGIRDGRRKRYVFRAPARSRRRHCEFRTASSLRRGRISSQRNAVFGRTKRDTHASIIAPLDAKYAEIVRRFSTLSQHITQRRRVSIVFDDSHRNGKRDLHGFVHHAECKYITTALPRILRRIGMAVRSGWTSNAWNSRNPCVFGADNIRSIVQCRDDICVRRYDGCNDNTAAQPDADCDAEPNGDAQSDADTHAEPNGDAQSDADADADANANTNSQHKRDHA
jgi:hypothetical protein